MLWSSICFRISYFAVLYWDRIIVCVLIKDDYNKVNNNNNIIQSHEKESLNLVKRLRLYLLKQNIDTFGIVMCEIVLAKQLKLN